MYQATQKGLPGAEGRIRRHAARRFAKPPRPAFPLLLILFLFFQVQAILPFSAEAAMSAEEYRVKAAFILNFAGFADWPDSALPDGIFTIGILGSDPFEGAMDALNGKSVKGRKVRVRRYNDAEDARGVDILYISPSEKRALPAILRTLHNRPILTVGDHPGFARAGVMINMVVIKKRVRFEINKHTAQQSGIRISSQLMKLAKEVIDQ
ncbi:MAG: hypothetical protein A4E69_01528 [Syntrophus sp. PtaB.Bin138]|nr:MAG: hypothetical protein A4E69_01528 [Syntrophus sp. PtaB.Bin138]